MTANTGRAFIGPPFHSLIARQRKTAPIEWRGLSYFPFHVVPGSDNGGFDFALQLRENHKILNEANP